MKNKLNTVEKFIIAFYFFSPFMYLIRVIFGDTLLGFILVRTMQPLLIVVVLLALYFSRVRFDLYSSAAILFLIYGVVAGFVNENKLFDIVTGASHFLIGFLLYLYYRNKKISECHLIKFLKITTYWCLISISFVISFLYVSEAVIGVNIYLGLASQVLIPLIFYAVYKKNSSLFIFILLLVVLSGKRGVLFAILLGFAFSFLPLFLSSYRKFLAKIILCIVIIFPTALIFGDNSFDILIRKFEINEKMTIDRYTSGRFAELKSAMDYWHSNNVRRLMGAGFGFTYTYMQENKALPDVDNYKNVHFSYFNPLIIFGFILGYIYLLLFFILLITVLIRTTSKGSIRPLLKASIFSYAIYACFAFVLFNEPLLWMIMGFLNSRNVNVEAS